MLLRRFGVGFIINGNLKNGNDVKGKLVWKLCCVICGYFWRLLFGNGLNGFVWCDGGYMGIFCYGILSF